MGNAKFSDDFKSLCGDIRSARFHSGWVSAHSLFAWVKKYSRPEGAAAGDDHAIENRRLKRELVRVTEEWDILKTGETFDRHWSEGNDRRWTSPRMQNEVDFYPRASADIFYPQDVSMRTRSPQQVLRVAK